MGKGTSNPARGGSKNPKQSKRALPPLRSPFSNLALKRSFRITDASEEKGTILFSPFFVSGNVIVRFLRSPISQIIPASPPRRMAVSRAKWTIRLISLERAFRGFSSSPGWSFLSRPEGGEDIRFYPFYRGLHKYYSFHRAIFLSKYSLRRLYLSASFASLSSSLNL